MKKNYTVIIPHKNIPNLLQRCLDSIPRREDIQIIVVDDNSDPAIVDFVNFPGLNDLFVEVIFTKYGKGAGYARNIGLRKARGKWLLFADADDFYNDGAFNSLDEYVNADYDAVYWKVNSVFSDTLLPSERSCSINRYIDEYLTCFNEDIVRYEIHTPWTKLVRTDFVFRNNICFDEVPAFNDTMFALKVGYYAHKICVDKRELYCVTTRHESLINTVTDEMVRSRMNVKMNADCFFKKINKSQYRPIVRDLFLQSVRCGFLTTLWCAKLIIMNRMIFWRGLGFKQFKFAIHYLSRR